MWPGGYGKAFQASALVPAPSADLSICPVKTPISSLPEMELDSRWAFGSKMTLCKFALDRLWKLWYNGADNKISGPSAGLDHQQRGNLRNRQRLFSAMPYYSLIGLFGQAESDTVTIVFVAFRTCGGLFLLPVPVSFRNFRNIGGSYGRKSGMGENLGRAGRAVGEGRSG